MKLNIESLEKIPARFVLSMKSARISVTCLRHIIRSVGMVHDITERKQLEQQVRNTQSILKTLLKSVLDSLKMLNA